ncbi:MAG: EamA family transporter, partial [Burkholderiales bacterium]
PQYLRRNWPRALLGGGLSAVSYAVALWAMTLAPVALVAVLRETSVVFAAALGALFLKEPFTARRAGATLVVLAGLVALRI